MTPFNYGTEWLLAQVYRFESIATSSQTFNKEDVIEYLNTELQTVITPLIQSVNEEFGVMYVDTPISALQASIRIPSQATGARLRNVQLLAESSVGNWIRNLPRLNPDKLYIAGGAWNLGFYIQNNELIFYPAAPTMSGTLRLAYMRRPNTLVDQLETGRVLTVDTLSNTVTLDNSPDGTGWVIGNTVDVIIGESPFDFRIRGATIIDINGSVIEFDTATIAAIQENDYVALEGQSPVAQFVPAEAMHVLAQLGAARCLQALGDTEGYKISTIKAQSMMDNLKNLISDRIEGQPKRISAQGLYNRGRQQTYY